MAEPNAKRQHCYTKPPGHPNRQRRPPQPPGVPDDALHMRIAGSRPEFSYTFVPCGAIQCVDRGFFSEDRDHALHSVELPSYYEMPEDGAEGPPRLVTEQASVTLACNLWITRYNTVTRFEAIVGLGGGDGVKDSMGWRHFCRLLVREHFQLLGQLLELFKDFGRRYLIGRPLRIIDDELSLCVVLDYEGQPIAEERHDGEEEAQ